MILLRLALCLAWLYGGAAWATPAARPEALRLDRALFAAGDTKAPPVQGWTKVALPDDWRLAHPQLNGFAWYRLRFSLRAPPERPLALYLPHLSLAGELWLNGSLLDADVHYDGPGGRMGSPMADAPLFLVLPSGLFRTGENVLEVRLQGSRSIRSGLSAIVIGPPEELRRAWLPRYAVQVVAPYVLLVLMGGALCFMLAYAWRQRRAYTVQFAMLIGVLVLISYLAVELPLSRGTAQAVRAGITTLMYWFLCAAGYRLSAARVPWFPPLLHGVSVLTLVAVLAWAAIGDPGDRIWQLTWPHLLLRAFVSGLLLRAAWHQRSAIYLMLGLTALLWVATMAQSCLILLDLLPWDSIRLSIVGALPFCIVLLFYFAERFILDRQETLLQQQAAVVAERERILQDMHDGIGAQLITALRMARRDDVDREELARSIEESMQDLRLIIESLDLTDQDLLPLLGNLRFRLQPRLHSLGIELAWDVQPLPQLDYLTPASALTILRIVQEAINNAVQHARPRAIRISVRPENTAILVEVTDDGPGFVSPLRQAGSRGLAGMRLRAERLGARMEIDSDGGGTRVRLLLPRHAGADRLP